MQNHLNKSGYFFFSLNHHFSICSSCSSTMLLHSKLLLSQRFSVISTRRISLDSYFDSVFSSQAVFPPPKFFFAVSAKPWLNLSTIPRQVVHARRRRSPAPIAGGGGSSKRRSSAAYSAGNGERGAWPGPMASAARKDKARGSPAALPARRSAAPQHHLAPPRPP